MHSYPLSSTENSDARRILKFWWVASWNIRQNQYTSKVYQKQKIKFNHLNTCSLKVVLGFVLLLVSGEVCYSIIWCSRSLNLHDDLVQGYIPSIITTRPLKLTWWPMWVEKLACEVFFFPFSPPQCQPTEPIKVASNVVIACKWLKSHFVVLVYLKKNEWWRWLCCYSTVFPHGTLRCWNKVVTTPSTRNSVT